MDQVKFFDSIAKDWDNIIRIDEKKINYLLSKIDIKEDDYILDVGTGTGVLIPFLVKLCPKGKIKAVDISCNMLDVARKKFNDINNVEFILLNVETDNLDEKFNKIVLYSMFPHLKDKTNTIKKLVQKNLLDCGKLIIAHSDSREYLNNMHKNTDKRVSESRLIDVNEQKKIFEDAGLKVEEAFEDNNIYYVVLEK